MDLERPQSPSKITMLAELSQEDTPLGSALRKLAYKAVRYNKESDEVTCSGLTQTEMPPEMFRDQLWRAFRLKFTDPEFDELVLFIDNDNNGTINGSEFFVRFIQLAFQERSKKRTLQLEKNRRDEAKRVREIEQRIVEAEQKMELEVDFDYTNADKESAMRKMSLASFKYDKNHPSSLGLDGFDGSDLSPGVFKEMCKRTFNMKLTNKEVAALLDIFDKDGDRKISTSEFLNHFFRLGFTQRSETHSKQLEKQRREIQISEEEQSLKLERQSKKNEMKVDWEYGTEDVERAMAKMTESAKKFDPTHPSSMGLEGFQGATMTPGVFREMLKRTFNMKLSNKELAALINEIDQDGDREISCQEFIRSFKRVGFEQRSTFLSEQLDKQRSDNYEREQEHLRKIKHQEDKAETQVDFDYSDEDKESALNKMRIASFKFDKNHPSSLGLDGFDGSDLSPGVFKEMVRRTFNMKLTSKEVGAMVDFFDSDGDRMVSTSEFLNHFFRLGFEQRGEFHTTQLLKQRKQNEDRLEHQRQMLETARKNREVEIDTNFTQEHLRSGLEKIEIVAAKYDKNHPSSVSLDGFQGASMTPGIFREMLKRTFNIRLSPKELGAVMGFFDSDNSGDIDSAEFLLHFFKCGFKAKNSKKTAQLKKIRKEERKERETHERIIRMQESEKRAKLQFGESDRLSALEKLRVVARQFIHNSSATQDMLSAFKGPSLSAEAFKYLFKRVFRIALTFPETGAMVDILDNNGNQMVDGSEFTRILFRLVRMEQKKMLGYELSEEEMNNVRPQTSSPMMSPIKPKGQFSVSSRPKTQNISIQTDFPLEDFNFGSLGENEEEEMMIPDSFQKYTPKRTGDTSMVNSIIQRNNSPQSRHGRRGRARTLPPTSPSPNGKRRMPQSPNVSVFQSESQQNLHQPNHQPNDKRGRSVSMKELGTVDQKVEEDIPSTVDRFTQMKEKRAASRKPSRRVRTPSKPSSPPSSINFFFPTLFSSSPVLHFDSVRSLQDSQKMEEAILDKNPSMDVLGTGGEEDFSQYYV